MVNLKFWRLTMQKLFEIVWTKHLLPKLTLKNSCRIINFIAKSRNTSFPLHLQHICIMFIFFTYILRSEPKKCYFGTISLTWLSMILSFRVSFCYADLSYPLTSETILTWNTRKKPNVFNLTKQLHQSQHQSWTLRIIKEINMKWTKHMYAPWSVILSLM